ncbi:hypothetical protein FOC1_g10001061, partial [Fusarium oxysporum f. sp. cubense race 1]
ILYTSHITKELLEKFHDPFKAPAGCDQAIISGLKIERGKTLGREIVATFDPDEIETWENNPEKPNSEKRKLDTPLNVLPVASVKITKKDTEEKSEIVTKKHFLNRDTPVAVTM